MDLSTMQQSLLVCFPRRRHIPEQIVLEILSRLPVQSLLRFRCVCKVWKSLISDPKFTLSTQKHHLAIKGRYLYSISLSWRRYPRFKPMLFYDDKSASERLKIIGSCNGLFLITHYTDFYLWNPSIRQSAIVLSLRTDEWPKDFSLDACAYPSGLCYDSSTDDYKAVMANELGEVTVVSFKRKLWATTTLHFVDKGNGYISLPGPIVNEKLHWAIAKFGNNHVTSFNPRTDEFEELPMPLLPNNGEGEPVINGLGVLDGCLCMARCVTRGSGAEEVGPGFFELLVMKEYGVGGSWTRILNVSKDFTVLSRETLVPLCFTGDGEVVISVAHLDRLRAYNLEDMSQREINVPFEGSITYQTSYTESLVSPEAYGHEEVWIVEAPDFLKGDGPIDLLSGKEKEKEKTKSTAAENQSDKQTNTRKKFGGARFA